MEIETILKEAVVIGIAAREAKTAELQQQAAQEGRQDEDLCGWSWINIDTHTFEKLQRLSLTGVRVDDDGDAVSPCKLYLEDVSHYHRLLASLVGLEAAATSIRSHGIKADQGGMLD
jgi:TnpA family transposase